MLETVTVHLVAGLDRVVPVREADKREPLGEAGVAVLGQEHSGDAAEALEHVAQFPFFRHLGDLGLHWLVMFLSA